MKDNNKQVYYWYGASIMILDSLQSAMHRHYPIEVYIGLHSSFDITIDNEQITTKAIAIHSNISHQISSSSTIALILFDPNLYHLNKSTFNDKGYFHLDDALLSSLTTDIQTFSTTQNSLATAKLLTHDIIKQIFSLEAMPLLDPRIKRLLDTMESIDEPITISTLAYHIGLSESRLSHLFHEQTNTSIKRYLLWLKLRNTIKHIQQGTSFTNAAHNSGFSDSAHFSRTYKEFFGITPSTLLKSFTHQHNKTL